MAFTAPATAPARALVPMFFAVFMPFLAPTFRDFPLAPDALRFDVLLPLARRLPLAFPLDRVVPLFRPDRAFPLRLVFFLVAIVNSWFSASARLFGCFSYASR